MTTALAERPMARRNDVTVELDAEVVRDAKLVAVYRDTGVAGLLSEILRPTVAKMLAGEQAKHSKSARRTKGGRDA